LNKLSSMCTIGTASHCPQYPTIVVDSSENEVK